MNIAFICYCSIPTWNRDISYTFYLICILCQSFLFIMKTKSLYNTCRSKFDLICSTAVQNLSKMLTVLILIFGSAIKIQQEICKDLYEDNQWLEVILKKNYYLVFQKGNKNNYRHVFLRGSKFFQKQYIVLPPIHCQ